MALLLSLAGPGLEESHRLEPGGAPLILGRDIDCSVCLPDPDRNISRRHLALWNEDDQLHFQVLSLVNGVRVDGQEMPPGARGVLGEEEVLLLSSFRITVAVTVLAPRTVDPWEDFEKEAARLVAAASVPASRPEDDPFGDWGFQSTFGPGSLNSAMQVAGLKPSNDLAAFFRGLGMAEPMPGSLTQAELETMGRLTRVALQGLLQTLAAAGGGRRALRSEDRTVLQPAQVNPLHMDTPVESKLWYLFGGQAAASGCIAPDRAVAELVEELVAHQTAMAEAAREAVQGAIEEFDPEALKTRLLGGGARLFESARAWDAFARDYAGNAQDLPGWVRRIMDRRFPEAYAQALVRVKRHTEAPGNG